VQRQQHELSNLGTSYGQRGVSPYSAQGLQISPQLNRLDDEQDKANASQAFQDLKHMAKEHIKEEAKSMIKDTGKDAVRGALWSALF
jgi:hypothetical protein